MKRKLDENDVPAEVEDLSNEEEDEEIEDVEDDENMEEIEEPIEEETTDEKTAAAETSAKSATATATKTKAAASFADFGLDHRLVQALAKLKFADPTLVQQKAIPVALDGKDVLAKAKTGSGKTAAYVLPVLQAILRRKELDSSAFTAALILVPTRELADQVSKNIRQFAAFCGKDVEAVKLADKVSDAVVRSVLSNVPDIVVSTPARAWHAASNGFLALDRLTHLVLDEADLVLSYGYQEDLESLAAAVPKHVQTILMSATLTTEVESLRGLLCRNEPVVLDLVEQDDATKGGLTQYVVKCGEDEKFLLAYVIFKLKLVTGKCLVFVADVDRCYRLKLFFEQFGIRSCILNSELPVNSRIHCIEQFNRNVYDIIIASDEHELVGGEEEEDEKKKEKEKEKQKEEEKDGQAPSKKRRTSRNRRDREFGVARGIDFKNVRAVINFDLPTSAKSYTHRIGRTARAGQTGMALSFVVPSALYRKHPPTSVETAAKDEKVLARIERQQAKAGHSVAPYDFDMRQVEAFRYRMNDALRSVTKVAVREARTREIRQELLQSEKLKRHFEENPDELHTLETSTAQHRHDNDLLTLRTQNHLKHVPDYLLPRDGKQALAADGVGFVSLRRRDDKKRIDRRKAKYFSRTGSAATRGKRQANPLKTFKARSKR